MNLHDHVAVIAPGLSLRRREALIATGRSLDVSTSVDSAIKGVREKLDSLPEPVPSRADARLQVAETATELEAKRERVATLRGRLQETDDGTVRAEYRRAIRELTEAETEHIAAKEALETARERARTARDSRDRRLRLEDRLGNLRRTARAELVEAVEPAANTATAAAPACDAETFREADPVSAALALARVGRIEKPIVLACRRFSNRDTAERWLETPVYRI